MTAGTFFGIGIRGQVGTSARTICWSHRARATRRSVTASTFPCTPATVFRARDASRNYFPLLDGCKPPFCARAGRWTGHSRFCKSASSFLERRVIAPPSGQNPGGGLPDWGVPGNRDAPLSDELSGRSFLDAGVVARSHLDLLLVVFPGMQKELKVRITLTIRCAGVLSWAHVSSLRPLIT